MLLTPYLQRASDVLGVGLVFPETTADTPIGYVSVRLPDGYEDAEYQEEQVGDQ